MWSRNREERRGEERRGEGEGEEEGVGEKHTNESCPSVKHQASERPERTRKRLVRVYRRLEVHEGHWSRHMKRPERVEEVKREERGAKRREKGRVFEISNYQSITIQNDHVKRTKKSPKTNTNNR